MNLTTHTRRLRCAMALAVTSAVALAPVSAQATTDTTADSSAASTSFSSSPSADGTAKKLDDRADPAAEQRRELNRQAVEKVISGEAKVENRNGSKAVKIAPGQWAQYGLQDSDQILSFLVDFGDQVDPRFPSSAPGPAHDSIPEPNRTVDNSTYWSDSFDREHYLDMFFSEEDESLKGVYEEMSSGRYTVDGDVSDWVTVPYNSASYGQTESQADMTRFVQDTANAWYDAQIAAGKTPAEIDAYLATFDQWDRYDFDKDGDFDEPDGYIDHFQAIHAGEGEEAGAAGSAIWSHRWSVGQAGRGTSGPAANPFGGVKIGNSNVWIRDYTTEPENGGLGVFAHEFGHDLGLPDLYDTSGGENGTGFWTLMSSGSWLSHGDGAIGTTPNHMGAWEKLQLGWLDYETATAGAKSTHKLGPSYHATKAPQAVVVNLPKDAAGNNRFYIAENRVYAGYDATLAVGPYNFGRGLTAPDTVEHYAYQDGLSITYWNTAQRNNNTRQHPGAGLALPVDAHPKAMTWSDGTVVRNRIQSFDATFGKQATNALSLTRETAAGLTTLTARSQPGVAVFDDTDPNAYYDAANPQGSVVVAGTGTRIEVKQSNSTGMLTLHVR
ncbi:immune inhibitor A domain-containing protein [uncultured Arthrobacter sp.]|uniref:immune inhibitor A domain-containing protein n=1 Tax=uncultured Arthrobacter sp. TaxID=114050 RepID=UPI0026089CC2|nr:immune inhibitor A domain-containing protein [uncultured Arthrobacter sp.]